MLAEVYNTTQTGADDDDEDVLNVSEKEAVISFMLDDRRRTITLTSDTTERRV